MTSTLVSLLYKELSPPSLCRNLQDRCWLEGPEPGGQTCFELGMFHEKKLQLGEFGLCLCISGIGRHEHVGICIDQLYALREGRETLEDLVECLPGRNWSFIAANLVLAEEVQ